MSGGSRSPRHSARRFELRPRASLYSLGHVIYKSGTLVPLDPVRRAAARVGESRAGAVAIPLNLWDIITVVARRV